MLIHDPDCSPQATEALLKQFDAISMKANPPAPDHPVRLGGMVEDGSLVRGTDGGFSVTVCNDKAGADESVEKARDWIAKNAASTGVGAPYVSEGPVILHLK